MGTHAAIFIPVEGQRYARIYCHYDGYPSNMLPALAHHDARDILAAGDLSAVSIEGGISRSPNNRAPVLTESLELPQWADHGYILRPTGWEHRPNKHQSHYSR